MVLNIFWQDMKKCFKEKYIYIAIIVSAIILLCSNVYEESGGKSYSVLTAVLNLDVKAIFAESRRLSVQEVMQATGRSRMSMFAPMLTLIPLIPILVSERNKGALRFQIFRTGKTAYIIGKFLTTVVIGGIVLLGGYAVFAGFVNIFYTKASPEIIEQFMITDDVYRWSGWFVYGAFSAVGGYLFTILIDNTYLIYSLPFIVNYLILTLVDRLSVNSEGFTIGKFVINPVTSFDTMSIVYATSFEDMYWALDTVIIQILFVIATVATWFIVVNKKTDCGV